MITKVNIGLQLSKNYDKVILEFADEPIEHDSDDELKAHIRKKFNLIREEVNLEFTKINK